MFFNNLVVKISNNFVPHINYSFFTHKFNQLLKKNLKVSWIESFMIKKGRAGIKIILFCAVLTEGI